MFRDSRRGLLKLHGQPKRQLYGGDRLGGDRPLRTNGFNKSHRLTDECVPLRFPVAHVPAPLKNESSRSRALSSSTVPASVDSSPCSEPNKSTNHQRDSRA